jgi:DNA-binding protein HU-beta
MANVSKKDLARLLSAKLDIKIVEATPIVDAFVSVLTEALTANERVEIRGFGRFVVKSVAARTARNPLNGAPVAVPATKKVQFRAATELKKTVAQGVTVEAASA